MDKLSQPMLSKTDAANNPGNSGEDADQAKLSVLHQNKIASNGGTSVEVLVLQFLQRRNQHY